MDSTNLKTWPCPECKAPVPEQKQRCPSCSKQLIWLSGGPISSHPKKRRVEIENKIPLLIAIFGTIFFLPGGVWMLVSATAMKEFLGGLGCAFMGAMICSIAVIQRTGEWQRGFFSNRKNVSFWNHWLVWTAITAIGFAVIMMSSHADRFSNQNVFGYFANEKAEENAAWGSMFGGVFISLFMSWFPATLTTSFMRKIRSQ